jgi:3-dehydroquinate synthase
VLLRGVPVLAEGSVIFAGLAGMPIGRFLLITSTANLCISAAYAGAGAYALGAGSFAAALAAAILLPGLGLYATGRLTRQLHRHLPHVDRQ